MPFGEGAIGGGGVLGPIGTVAAGIYDVISGGTSGSYRSPGGQTLRDEFYETGTLSPPPPPPENIGAGTAPVQPNPPQPGQPQPPARVPIPGTPLSLPAGPLGQLIALLYFLFRGQPRAPRGAPGAPGQTVVVRAPSPVVVPPTGGSTGGSMPYVTTTPFAADGGGGIFGGGGNGGFLGGLTGLANAVAPIISSFVGPGNVGGAATLPGGASTGVPSTMGLELPGIDVVQGGSSEFLGAFVSSPYRMGTQSGPRAQDFAMRNPTTGRLQYWRYAGRPLIYSGDRGICRRVKKTARRLGG